MFQKLTTKLIDNKVQIISTLTVASTTCATQVFAADPAVLTLPAIDIVPFLNMYTGWLTTNVPTLLSVAGGIGLVGFAFRKAKSFLFG